MPATSNIEIVKKNAALVVGLVASMLIAPPELAPAGFPVKWVAINGVIAILIAGFFAVWLPKVPRQRIRSWFILLGAGFLLLAGGVYYACYTNWTCTCDTEKNQYQLVIGTRLTPEGEAVASNLRTMRQEVSNENLVFAHDCRSSGLYDGQALFTRYFLLIAIYIATTMLLLAVLSLVNYLLYYATDTPNF